MVVGGPGGVLGWGGGETAKTTGSGGTLGKGGVGGARGTNGTCTNLKNDNLN